MLLSQLCTVHDVFLKLENMAIENTQCKNNGKERL